MLVKVRKDGGGEEEGSTKREMRIGMEKWTPGQQEVKSGCGGSGVDVGRGRRERAREAERKDKRKGRAEAR